jgi:ribosomal protein S12 methylthiotransferase
MPEASPKVALLTLGCAKNLVDSELIASRLAAAGAEVVHALGGCPVAVVNTCGFIQPAKEESIEVILDVADRKDDGDLRTLIVTGCLSQRYGAELETLLPEVDVFTGVDPAGAADVALEALGLGAPASVSRRRHRLTPGAWSYLRISHGCDNRCAYCAIPMIRGPLRSRPMEEVIEEARRLAEDGVRELNVIAQDTASYGVDIYGERCVHTLLRELCRIGELRWIRLLYAHPAHLYDELMDAVAEEEKVCPYVDVPLQHVSDRVLRRMGRGLTRAESEELVSALRRRIPGVTLRTTFLTGFPGETEEDFAELLDFVREMRFERLGAFAYSPEEGTAAEGLPDQVPQEVAERRRDELMATQQEIAFELAAERVGERAEVLMEEGEPLEGDLHPARSPHEAPDVDPLIYVHAPAPPPGEFARVEIVDAVGYDCIARVVEESDRGAS